MGHRDLRTDGPTDGRTYGRTDRPSYRDAKNLKKDSDSLDIVDPKDILKKSVILISDIH